MYIAIALPPLAFRATTALAKRKQKKKTKKKNEDLRHSASDGEDRNACHRRGAPKFCEPQDSLDDKAKAKEKVKAKAKAKAKGEPTAKAKAKPRQHICLAPKPTSRKTESTTP